MKYNDGLKQLHNEKREETVQTVLDAIEEIKTHEGKNAIISALKLVEYTGLSRATFYKSHILKVWNEKLWQKRFGEKESIIVDGHSELEVEIVKLKEEIEHYKNQLKKALSLNESLKEKLETEKQRSSIYRDDIKELERAKEILTGKIASYQMQLTARGIEVK